MAPVTSTDHDVPRPLLDRLEHYYDSVPRAAARVEEFGPLSLFVREGAGFPYYARPALAMNGTHGEVDVADVNRIRARQRELGVPESFEWVAETTPALRAAVTASGLDIHEHPLMVLDSDAEVPKLPILDEGASVRLLDTDDDALPSALALLWVAFGQPDTAVGAAGVAELDRAVHDRAGDGTIALTADRIRAGLTRVAAAVQDGRALSSGSHQPVGDVSEIVAVGTLPAARRRGLGLAVTAALVADARSLDVKTFFLSASDDAVARIYARLGFRRVGTALIAEPAE
ncbi:ribosomal protein S18 acetylase RimI-like enzyme [Streptacidiphilus sp. MAP12-20]|uniref:GNAT family N-acetyltransferase n=1 Tax=Streptacidiphilus sp. MAP12-20 TaxID=3156299 RepID=UPI003515D93D